jgi:hypothetical protein
VSPRLALYQAAAAFEQIRGIVRHFSAFLIQLAALVERLAAHVFERLAPVLCLLAQITPRILTRLRCVEQRDGGAERRPRKKPEQSVRLFHTLILPIPGRAMVRAMLRA